MGLLDWARALLRPSPPPRLALTSGGERAAAPASPVRDALAESAGGWRLPRRGQAETLGSLGKHPTLHAVVNRRAESLGALPWLLFRRVDGQRATREDRAFVRSAQHHVRDLKSPADRRRSLDGLLKSGALERVATHPLLDLLEHPCEGMTAPAFWELVSTWMDACGEAPLVKERDDGVPFALTPITPTLISQVPTPSKPWFVVGRMKSGKELRVAIDDMIWIRRLDPENPYTGRGIGTAQVLGDEVETDEYMSATAKARFANRNIADVVLGLLGFPEAGFRPNAAAVTKLKAEVEQEHTGPDRSGRFLLLGSDFKAQDLSSTFQQSQFVEGRRFLRDAIMQGFGATPEVMGVLENANKGTVYAARMHFALYSTQPMADRICAALQDSLVPEFGDDLLLDYVSPVPEDDERKEKLMVALPSAFRKNEVRTFAGELPDPEGDGWMVAPGAPRVPIEGDPQKTPKPDKKAKADDKEEDPDAVPDA